MDNLCVRVVLVVCLCGIFGCRNVPAASTIGGQSGSGGIGTGGRPQTMVDAAPGRYLLHTFTRQTLDTAFRAEGASFADLDRDGHNDLIAGSFWYRGPDFANRVSYYEGRTFDGATSYSNDFFIFTDDLDADGWVDIVQIGFPGQETFWYRNPGAEALARVPSSAWQRHLILSTTDNESPTYVDLTGDAKRELVCIHKGDYGYATPFPGDPTAPWQFHRISNDGGRINFTHGMGIGDVDGDGRQDLLERSGWWRQPTALASDPVWERHPFEFSPWGGAQMFAFDVDGDGDNDVVTSLAAHGFGLAWFEQVAAGKEPFVKHDVLGDETTDNPFGIRFAELHALALIDMDQDGLLDVITGKRFWSHGPDGDPEGPNADAVLYWFRLTRSSRGVEFVPHRMDTDSGVGTQVVAGDVMGDGYPDVVISNKKGTFIIAHTATDVSYDAWRAAEPTRLRP